MTFFTYGKMHIGSKEENSEERECEVILEQSIFHLTLDLKCNIEAPMLEILETKLYVGREIINLGKKIRCSESIYSCFNTDCVMHCEHLNNGFTLYVLCERYKSVFMAVI